MSLTAPCISIVPLLRRSKLQHLVTRSGALRLRTCGVESHFQCKVQQRNGKVITWRPTIPTGLFFMDLAAAMPWVPSVATHPRPGPSPWDPPQIIRSKRLAGVSERGQRAHLQHAVTRRRRRGRGRLCSEVKPSAGGRRVRVLGLPWVWLTGGLLHSLASYSFTTRCNTVLQPST